MKNDSSLFKTIPRRRKLRKQMKIALSMDKESLIAWKSYCPWTKRFWWDENSIVRGRRVSYLIKIISFAVDLPFISLKSFPHWRIVCSSHKFSFVCGEFCKNVFSNILSVDNSIFNRWNSLCPWTKIFLSVETFFPWGKCWKTLYKKELLVATASFN